jgi:ParB/RepB/Spo0J family partition protein
MRLEGARAMTLLEARITTGDALQLIPLAALRESPENPRKTFDGAKLDELAASIKAKGVIVPLLVRPRREGTFEIAAGHRRSRAAKLAGLAEVPAIVREMSDQQFLELITFENLEREDLHPLEEAAGYRNLMAAGWDVTKIAGTCGKSTKYVYDRVKLLALASEARALFQANEITAGHAILLARLAPADQQRAIGGYDRGGFRSEFRGGLFTVEAAPEDPEDPGEIDTPPPRKVRSVRELAAWIDEHVKFNPAAVDPVVHPETAEVLATKQAQGAKVVPITRDYYVQPDARDGKRVITPRSWKRADGSGPDAKACAAAVTGLVVVGPGRSETLQVCVDKTCTTHWAAEQRERKQAASARAANGEPSRGADPWKAERERGAAEAARWEKAAPALLAAVAERIKRATGRAGGPLDRIILDTVRDYWWGGAKKSEYVPRGTTAEDLVRHLAFSALRADLDEGDSEMFMRRAKPLGVDVKAIVDRAAAAAPAAVTSADGARPAHVLAARSALERLERRRRTKAVHAPAPAARTGGKTRVQTSAPAGEPAWKKRSAASAAAYARRSTGQVPFGRTGARRAPAAKKKGGAKR